MPQDFFLPKFRGTYENIENTYSLWKLSSWNILYPKYDSYPHNHSPVRDIPEIKIWSLESVYFMNIILSEKDKERGQNMCSYWIKKMYGYILEVSVRVRVGFLLSLI